MTELGQRLKAAFAANNIPWDGAWLRANTETQLTVAEHWERRASGDPVFNYVAIGKALSVMAGFPNSRGDGELTYRQRMKLPGVGQFR